MKQVHLQANLFHPFPSPFQKPGMGSSLVPIFKQVPYEYWKPVLREIVGSALNSGKSDMGHSSSQDHCDVSMSKTHCSHSASP